MEGPRKPEATMSHTDPGDQIGLYTSSPLELPDDARLERVVFALGRRTRVQELGFQREVRRDINARGGAKDGSVVGRRVQEAWPCPRCPSRRADGCPGPELATVQARARRAREPAISSSHRIVGAPFCTWHPTSFSQDRIRPFCDPPRPPRPMGTACRAWRAETSPHWRLQRRQCRESERYTPGTFGCRFTAGTGVDQTLRQIANIATRYFNLRARPMPSETRPTGIQSGRACPSGDRGPDDSRGLQ